MDVPERVYAGIVQCLLLLCMEAGLSQAGVTLDGTLGAAGPLTGPNYLIPDSVGRQVGSNLFHSFGLFSLASGERATFTGPDSVSNIIGRVTGGQVSTIEGVLRSEIPGANLYLINPAGVVFGAGAALEVSGSFHVGTADYLRLADGGVFHARDPASTVLTSAPPSAFGFLGAPAGLTLQDNVVLAVPAGQTVSLVAGDISLKNGSISYAPGGRINVAALAGAGEVEVSHNTPQLEVTPDTPMGQLEIDGSTLSTRGDGGGTVLIRAGHFVLANKSQVSTTASGPTDGSLASAAGAGIDIRADGVVLSGNTFAELNSNVEAGVANAAPPIRIRTGQLEVRDGANINSVAKPGSLGPSGGIQIDADEVEVHHGGVIRSNTAGSGDSGDLAINAGRVAVHDGGLVYTIAFGGSGDSGNIVVNANELALSNTEQVGLTAILSETHDGTGAPGNLRITANTLTLAPTTQIYTLSYGPQAAGNVDISATQINISGVSGFGTGIFANTSYDGTAGNVNVNTDSLVIDNFGGLEAISYGNGQGGNISVTARTMDFSQHAYLSAFAFGSGNAGNITLEGENISLSDGARAWVFSSGSGSAGNISIAAGTLELSGYASAADPLDVDFTGLSAATTGVGQGGNINIMATGSFTATNRAMVTTFSSGTGHAGSLDIDAAIFSLQDGAQIFSNAFGAGNGGNVHVAAGDMLLDGVHPEPFANFGRAVLAPSAIGAQTTGSAAAGRVDIQAGQLRVMDGARISTETFGSGEGGSLTIDAGEVVVTGRNAVQHAFLLDQGLTPQLADESARAAIAAGSTMAGNTIPTGGGGDVKITAESLEVADQGLIMSNSMGAGDGGSVMVNARKVLLTDGGMIAARSTGTGSAGSLHIEAGERFTSIGGLVSTESDSAGGGSIVVNARDRLYLRDASITTSVQGGGGDAGNIEIDPRFVILDNGRITANAFGGAGGNIHIVSEYFLTSGASLVEASSALGVDGSVQIQAVDTQVTEGLEGPRAEYFDASALLRPKCAARTPGQTSSFTVSGRGGLPPDPDSPAWSGYSGTIGYTGETAAGDAERANAAFVAAAHCRG
jgi:filamentous hemagglutinin family protein